MKYLLLLFFLVFTILSTTSFAQPTANHVLLINSYDQGMSWVADITKAVNDVLQPEKTDVILHIENMDTKKIFSEDYFQKLYELFKIKYQNAHLELIISSDNNAFEFLRKHHHDLFPQSAVVFCGVNYFKDEQIANFPLFTGVEEIFDDVETVNLILKLHPHVKQIYVINDYLETGQAWTKTMEENFKKQQMNEKVKITFSENLPIADLQQAIRQLDKDTVVLIGVYYKDRDGTYFTYEKIGKLLADASPVPVYALLAFNLGHRVVGGKLISGYHQGEAAAQLGKRILAGELPKNIPVVRQGANRFMFDYRELERFKIDLSLLPEDSIITHEPISFYSQYKVLVWSVVIIFAFLAVVVVAQRRILYIQQKAISAEKRVIDSLKQIDKLKDEFLANTSHELRTPLNGIIGIAESLLEGIAGTVSEKMKANLTMIVTSGKRLAALVNDILDFSKLKHKNIELQLKSVGLQEIAEMVLFLNRPLIIKKSLQLVNAIANDLPPVLADENRLQQILHNLVGNAIKFTESGQVEIRARVNQSIVEVTVADTGIGIPEDKQGRIFESFEQADGSTAREYGGTGLGLAVTKQLVELHGGTLTVISQVGAGSQFTFTLPIATGEFNATATVPQVSKIQATTLLESETVLEPTVVMSSPSNCCILAVDDEPVNLQVLNNFLSLKAHCNIVQANSGIEAMKLIEKGLRPDIILLDVMMPKMNGYEVTQMLRKTWTLSELPILLLTAKNRVEDLVTGLEAGANDYLTKPFSKDELIARINTHLNVKRLKEENMRMQTELDISRHLQQVLLPKKRELSQIHGLEVAGFMEPAKEVGGDYYDVLIHSGGVKIGIGDVTGHGLESGILAMMVQTAVRTLLTHGETNAVKFLATINRTIYDNVQRMEIDRNLTLCLLDWHENQLHISGQHEEVLIVRHGQVEVLDTADLGFTVGLEPDIAAFVAEKSIILHTGDVVVLYTDGVTEAENISKEFYGLERLHSVVNQHWQQSASEIKQAIIEDVHQFIGQKPLLDDVTLVILKQA